MLRMKPTPESSEGAGEARFLLTGVVVTRAAALVCETLRARLGTGVADVARVLLSHVGLSRVIVTLTECPSSECGVTFLFTGVVAVLRLAGRGTLCGTSGDMRRVPNFAFADDSRL